MAIGSEKHYIVSILNLHDIRPNAVTMMNILCDNEHIYILNMYMYELKCMCLYVLKYVHVLHLV